jgi:GAF domain-containing protein
MGQLVAFYAEGGCTARDLNFVERLATLYALAVQRARSDTALRECVERFRAVTDSLGAPIYVADAETHKLLLVNEHTGSEFGAGVHL